MRILYILMVITGLFLIIISFWAGFNTKKPFNIVGIIFAPIGLIICLIGVLLLIVPKFFS